MSAPLSPLKPLTVDQATSWLQKLHERLTARIALLPKFSLPAREQEDALQRLDMLQKHAGVLEKAIWTVCAWMPDKVVEVVIAILAAKQYQTSLVDGAGDKSTVAFIFDPGTIQSLDTYLQHVTAHLSADLSWAESPEGRRLLREVENLSVDICKSRQRFARDLSTARNRQHSLSKLPDLGVDAFEGDSEPEDNDSKTGLQAQVDPFLRSIGLIDRDEHAPGNACPFWPGYCVTSTGTSKSIPSIRLWAPPNARAGSEDAPSLSPSSSSATVVADCPGLTNALHLIKARTSPGSSFSTPSAHTNTVLHPAPTFLTPPSRRRLSPSSQPSTSSDASLDSSPSPLRTPNRPGKRRAVPDDSLTPPKYCKRARVHARDVPDADTEAIALARQPGASSGAGPSKHPGTAFSDPGTDTLYPSRPSSLEPSVGGSPSGQPDGASPSSTCTLRTIATPGAVDDEDDDMCSADDDAESFVTAQDDSWKEYIVYDPEASPGTEPHPALEHVPSVKATSLSPTQRSKAAGKRRCWDGVIHFMRRFVPLR
ncbi:hypothetical protein BD414DRAFT_501083 [Trametes punicea]|nr:hypothetical protein BD414DRAFT_501083 [Trametes punicea]